MNIFPHPLTSNKNDIIAIGGDLSTEVLLLAYHYGVFPWYNDDTPILWWFPKRRYCLIIDEMYISKSMMKTLKRQEFSFTINKNFSEVIRQCAITERPGQVGSWLNSEMEASYVQLHRLGYTHSVEVWKDDVLVGGLYGVSIGKYFCGESMFSHVPNASKAAFIYLAIMLKMNGFEFVDCQQKNEFLATFNCTFITDRNFYQFLFMNRVKHMYHKNHFVLPTHEQLIEEAEILRRSSIQMKCGWKY